MTLCVPNLMQPLRLECTVPQTSSMSVRPLPFELAEKASQELNEDPKRLEDGIQQLKEWIAKNTYLRARTDDQWLAAVLRGCKHSVEKAKVKIDLYYTVRGTAPELYLPHTDPKFMDILKSGVVLVLPKTAGPTGPRVVLVRSKPYDPDKVNISEFFSVMLVLQQIMYMEDDDFVVSGVINIVDFEGATLAHFLQMTPAQMKKLVVAGQDAAPVRVRSSHYLNTSPSFDTVYNIGKKIMSEKHKNRIRIHKSPEELFEFVPKDILPVELGGDGGTIDEIIDYWVKKVEEYRDWLSSDQQYGTDEDLRPGKPLTAGDLFGVDGSFRQLDFD